MSLLWLVALLQRSSEQAKVTVGHVCSTQLLPSWMNVAVQAWAHCASSSEVCFLSHLPLHTHKPPLNANVPLARVSEHVGYMWFWLATPSPHNGPILTTSSSPLWSTCIYGPFSECHCVFACKSACMYMHIIFVHPSLRPSWVEQWIKVSGPKRATEAEGGEGVL